MKKMYTMLITPLIMTGCSTSPNGPTPVDFPENALLRADVEGTYENLEIECVLNLLITQVEEELRTAQTMYSTIGGEAQRAVFNEDGSGVSFFGNAFDSVKIEFPTPDEIVISSRMHEPTGESRFGMNCCGLKVRGQRNSTGKEPGIVFQWTPGATALV